MEVQCATTTTMTVVVNAVVTPTFAQLGPYCVGATAGLLSGTSIEGITGTWTPAVISTSTPGSTLYTFTPDGGQCATTATMTVVVNAVCNAYVRAVRAVLCRSPGRAITRHLYRMASQARGPLQ